MSRLTIASLTLLIATFAPAADEKPRLTISQIMKQAHISPYNRGTRNNLDNKVIDGKATDEEKKKLLELYRLLSESKPPMGELDAWKKRTAEMIDSVEAVIRGDEKAVERLKKARNCRDCHILHRKSH